jgi:hypothetical protein
VNKTVKEEYINACEGVKAVSAPGRGVNEIINVEEKILKHKIH